MLKKAVIATLLAVCLANNTAADVVCPDSSYVEVIFNRTYPDNSQFAGQPYDYLTIAPSGKGETFRNVNGVNEYDGLLDIEVRVYIRNCQGVPIAGIPAAQINLFSNSLCICPGGSDADIISEQPDGPGTDANGMATFTGSLNAGGCTSQLDVYADGMFIGTLMDATGRTVKVNSADQAHLLSTPCWIDTQDVAGFASVFTQLAANAGNICVDLNERGKYIDASDLAAYAFARGAYCR